MKTMKHGAARLVSLLLTLTMVLGLLPAAAFAAEPAAEQVTVRVDFDYRSVGSEEMLTAIGIDVPHSASAQVPAGSTVYEALEAARSEGAFKPVYDKGFDGSDNGFVSAFNGVGGIRELCESMGADYADTYQYAGWMYTVNGADGMGIQNDKLTENTTITFRYSVYSYWDGSQSVMVDWAFVDAFDGLTADLAAVKTLDRTAYTQEQWAKVEEAAASGEQALAAADPDGLAASGMMLNYVTSKGSTLWGPGSPTDTLTKARAELKRAVDKVVAPEKITLPEGLELTAGTDYQLVPVVLPEGAPQDVTFEILLGGDAFTISESGLIHPTGKADLCMIQIRSAEDPTVMANLRFKIKAGAPVVNQQAEPVMHTIAASFQNASDEWSVMDMGAYQLANPDGVKLSAQAKQDYLNAALGSLLNEKPDEAVVFKAILALRSQGMDPAAVTPFGASQPIDLYELLAGMEHSTSLWKAPYTLMAFHLADPTHKQYQEQTQPLLEALMKDQAENGSWNEWGTVDATANAVTALALYTEVEGVSAAVEKGVSYLASIQQADGSFGVDPTSAWGAANSNSTSMVLIALAAAGVNPVTDPRFVTKEGRTALDGLMVFATADGKGFGYMDNKRLDAMATEQAFRALIPVMQMVKTGKAVNVYDVSAVDAQPAAATARSVEVTVDFEGEANVVTIENVPAGLVPVVDGKVVRKSVAEDGRLKLILTEDCTVSLVKQSKDFTDVSEEDWYAAYVDFAAVRQIFAGVTATEFAPELGLTRAQAVTILCNLEEGKSQSEAPFHDLTQDWYKAPVAWGVENGVTAGVGAGKFAPDAAVTRQELAQMMYNYAKALGLDVTVQGQLEGYTDADTAADWAVEALTWAVENGIMVGDGAGHLAPAAAVTRAQAAAMMGNLVSALVG